MVACDFYVQGWGLNLESLQGALDDARRQGLTVRALVFINPGNPTGNCLTEEDLQALVRFAHNNRYDYERLNWLSIPSRCDGGKVIMILVNVLPPVFSGAMLEQHVHVPLND